MRSVSVPPRYRTNEVPEGGKATFFLTYVPSEIRAQAEETTRELLEWLAEPILNDDDRLGALLAALMLRHRDPGAERLRPTLFLKLRGISGLDAAMDTTNTSYLFAPFDRLLDGLRQKITD